MVRDEGAMVERPYDDQRSPHRALVVEAVRYWEPRRLVYNLALSVVVIGNALLLGPTFWSQREYLIPFLTRAALLANICYCAAYPIDLFLEAPERGGVWPRRRWVLFTSGTVFAMMIAQFLTMVAAMNVMPRTPRLFWWYDA
jgi:hypothetical protein